jgi:hypothetical protein
MERHATTQHKIIPSPWCFWQQSGALRKSAPAASADDRSTPEKQQYDCNQAACSIAAATANLNRLNTEHTDNKVKTEIGRASAFALATSTKGKTGHI